MGWWWSLGGVLGWFRGFRGCFGMVLVECGWVCWCGVCVGVCVCGVLEG